MYHGRARRRAARGGAQFPKIEWKARKQALAAAARRTFQSELADLPIELSVPGVRASRYGRLDLDLGTIDLLTL